MQKMIDVSPRYFAVVLSMIVISGCGAAITPTSDPVEVTIKVTAKGQPVKERGDDAATAGCWWSSGR